MARRIPGATTYYELKADRSVVVRQGTDETNAVLVADSRAPLVNIRHLWTTADNGVFAQADDDEWYEIRRDDLAYPTTREEYEQRRDTSRALYQR